MLRRAVRFLIAVALLAAQQAALGHQIWHLGKKDSQPAQNQLCEQHAALATVAGAVDCASSDTDVVTTTEFPRSLVAAPCATASRLAPTSRSPPQPLC